MTARRPWLTRTVLVLGVVSLLTDAATEMIIPFLPLFITDVLGASAVMVGVVEGAADAVASVLKLVSGRWADRIGRNRPFVLAGYGIASVVRPFVAAATVAGHVLAVRVLDRIGKGLRSSPRDAMIAASVDEKSRGTAYGFHRAMDHTGAMIGPLIAIAVVEFWTDDLRTLFWLTAIPGALAVLTLVIGLREDRREKAAPEEPPEPLVGTLPPERRRELLSVLVPIGLFTLGNASDVFLLLKAGGARASLTTLPLLWIALHLVKALSSTPGGKLADRLGARRTIAIGWTWYALIYVGFAFATDLDWIWALFVAYGLYHGLTEGAEKALIASIATPETRGTAFGWYYLTVGLLALPASVGFGVFWATLGNEVAFGVSAALAVVATLVLVLAHRPAERAQHGA